MLHLIKSWNYWSNSQPVWPRPVSDSLLIPETSILSLILISFYQWRQTQSNTEINETQVFLGEGRKVKIFLRRIVSIQANKVVKYQTTSIDEKVYWIEIKFKNYFWYFCWIQIALPSFYKIRLSDAPVEETSVCIYWERSGASSYIFPTR